MNIQYCAPLMMLALLLVVVPGCESTSSAPFHMYSSPLVEGEMQAPRTGTDADGDDSSPGVEARQVYTYQRFHPDAAQPSAPGHRTADRGSGSGASFDTVQAPSEAVLANYQQEPTGDADTTSESSASPGLATPPDDDDIDSGDRAASSAGYIYAILEANDLDVDDDATDSIPQLYRSCRSQGETFHSSQPNIGDLVFFHNTYDKNDDGRNNDWYTLVGIVEDLRSNGTIDFLAYHDGAVRSLQINPDRLDDHQTSAGETLNSQLREERDDDPPYTRYLAGELFAGFCDILGEQSELLLTEEWSPQ